MCVCERERGCSDSGRSAQRLGWVGHTGMNQKTDWVCSAPSSSLLFSQRLRDKQQLFLCCLSLPLPFTQTVEQQQSEGWKERKNERKVGGLQILCSVSLSPSSASSISPQVWPKTTVAGGINYCGWGGSEVFDIYIKSQVFILSIVMWETVCSMNNTAHKCSCGWRGGRGGGYRWRGASLPPSAPPFHNRLPIPLFASPTPACWNESSAVSQSNGGTQLTD